VEVTIYEVLHAVDVALFHIHTSLASTFCVVAKSALLLRTFYAGTCSRGLADLTHDLKPFLVDGLHSFDVDCAVPFFEVHFRYPYCTSVVNPHEVTVRRLFHSLLVKVVVVIVQLLLIVLLIGLIFAWLLTFVRIGIGWWTLLLL